MTDPESSEVIVSSKRERLILFVAVVVLGLYGLDAVVLTPLVDKTAVLRRQQEQLEAALLANVNTLKKRRVMARSWQEWKTTFR